MTPGRRKPSRTTRIFSSGVYLRRVAAFTVRTKDLVSSLRPWAASVLLSCDWDTSTPFCEYITLSSGAHATSTPSGLLTPNCVPLSLTVYTDDPQGIFLIEGNVFENVGRFTVRSRYPFTAIFRNNRFVSKWAGSNYWIQSLRCYSYAGNSCTPILVETNSFLDDGVALSLTEATLGENDPAIDARNNFWDTTDESLIASRIADKNVDISLSGEIPFKPFLTEPHPDTP